MKPKLSRALAVAGLVALGGVATTAQARDNVYWSLGVNAAPGVALGVGNVPPVYVAPQPVYVAPQPVYMAPPPPVVVVPRPVYYGYYGAAPVYVRPAPVYYGYGEGRGHRHHHREHRGRDRD
jgi:hypothetical protein